MPHLLAIGIDDFIQVLVPVVFLVMWILSQVLGHRRDQPAPPAKGGRRPVRPEALEELSQEVEDFLKRAARKRAGPPRPDGGRQAAAGRKEPPQRVRPRPRPAVITAEIARPKEVSELRKRHEVAAHADAHLRGERFEEETSRLGEEVEDVEERTASRLHAKFDHQVGRLTETDVAGHGETGQEDTGARVSGQQPAGVQQFGDLLRSPAGIRQAVILQEILSRPEHRW